MKMKKLIEMNNSNDFLIELKALLEKYNADISADVDGDDLSGVSVKIVIDVNNKTVLSNYDMINHHDIKLK